MATYLKDFEKMAERGIAYVPLGTLEWHGNHLPIETDFLIAARLCEEFAKKKPGYILPPIYLGTDKSKSMNGKKFCGMDWDLKKILPGNIYHLETSIFEKALSGLIKNLKEEGFEMIYLIAGHTGPGHMKALRKVSKKTKGLIVVDPYEKIKTGLGHADEYETSLLWACHPEEEKKSRTMKISASDDFLQFQGYDPRKKASLRLGKKILKEVVENCLREINRK